MDCSAFPISNGNGFVSSGEGVSTRPPKKRKFDADDTVIKVVTSSILKSCIPLEKKVKIFQAKVHFDDKVLHIQTFGRLLSGEYKVNTITNTLPLIDEHSAASQCPTKADLLEFERTIGLGKRYPDLLVAEDKSYIEEKIQTLLQFENLFCKPVIKKYPPKIGKKALLLRDNIKLCSGHLTKTRKNTMVKDHLGTPSWQNPEEFEFLLAELYQRALNQLDMEKGQETPANIEKMMVFMRDNTCTEEVTTQELKDILFDYFYKKHYDLPIIDGELDMIEVEAMLEKLIDVSADYHGDMYVLTWSPISKKDVAIFLKKKFQQLAESPEQTA